MTTTNENKDRLVLHYADQFITALDHAAEVRRILNETTWSQAGERFDALVAANGGPVIRRGSREWHYATPNYPVKWAHLGSPHPAPDPISVYAVIASDGSQIFPDQGSRFPWAIIRIVTFCLKYGTAGFERAHAREIEAIVTADDDDELFHILTADLTPQERNAKIGGLRNRVEIRQAASVADFPYAPGPKVVMTDGPIHLFEPEDNDAIIIHARALQSALDVGAIPVGVIAGGDARYTVRLAALLSNSDDRAAWPDVTDFDVWAGALDEGERSPLFGIASSYNYAEHALPVAFFYLKTGSTALRVEVPANLTNVQLRQVAQVVLAESQGLEYPYALWKAHERVVLRGGERAAYTAGWAKMLSRYGLVDSLSPKQRLKDLA